MEIPIQLESLLRKPPGELLLRYSLQPYHTYIKVTVLVLALVLTKVMLVIVVTLLSAPVIALAVFVVLNACANSFF